MNTGGNVIRRTVAVYLALIPLVFAYGAWCAVRHTEEVREAPRPLVGDSRYGRILKYLRDVDVAGFTSDRHPRNAHQRYYNAQYALAPTALVAEPDPMKTLRKLIEGYTLIADMQDVAMLNDRIDGARRLLAERGMELDVFQITHGLVVMKSRRP